MKQKHLLQFVIPFIFLNACSKPPISEEEKIPDSPSDVTYSEAIAPAPLPEVNFAGYTTYYFNAEGGDDSNDGLSSRTPFQNLSIVVQLPKNPGTRILLKSGSRFKGCLELENLGSTEEKPFVVDIYDGSERARIDGQGVYAAISVKDDNVRINRLEVTNKTGRLGCWIQTVEKGAMKNIQISGCRFHEINWRGDQEFIGKRPEDIGVYTICPDDTYAKYYGGITADALTTKEIGPSWFENLYIVNNEFFQVCRTGILLNTQWGQRINGYGYNEFVSDEEGWYPNKNVVIQGNHMNYIGGDGLILGGCLDSFIDHNVCYYANLLGRTNTASAGLWPYMSVNTVMQYNEVAYTQWTNGSADGEGLDIDGACKNTLCQYNYVHHNVGGGLMMCNFKETDHCGHIIRNNIFAFNGGKVKGCFMVIQSGTGKTDVYNNLVVTSSKDKRVIYSDDYGHCGNNHDFTFRNNIFMSTDPCSAIFDHSYIDNAVFENNIYFNMGSFQRMDEYQKLYDPEIDLPDEFDGWERILQYKPRNAKVFENGMLFDGMAAIDINGASTQGILYLGPFAQ